MFQNKFIFILFSLILIHGQEMEAKQPSNPSIYLQDKIWIEIQDYLLPNDHPVKEKLNHICLTSRAFANKESLIAAGFDFAQLQGCTQIVVTRHPELPGYIIKAYLDSTPLGPKGRLEQEFFIQRIVGSRLATRSIQAHGYQHLFKVPEKWLYLLPDIPSPPKHSLRRMFILVENDMDIFNDEKNKKLWGSHLVSTELLDALYTIVTEVGLADSTKPSNCPFSKDGRIALIDTQVHSRYPVKYHKLTSVLSPSMQTYWINRTRSTKD